MAEEIFKFGGDDEELIKALNNIEAKFTDVQKTAVKSQEIVQDSINQTSEEAARLAMVMQETAKQEEATAAKRAENAKRFAAQEEAAAKRHKDSLAALEREAAATAKVATAFQQQVKAQKQVEQQTNSTNASSGKFLGTIGGLVGRFAKFAGIGSVVVGVMSKLESVMDFVDKVMGAVSATVNTLLNRVSLLVDSVVALFSGDFTGAAENFSAAFDNIGGAIIDAAVAGYELAGALQALRDEEIALAVAMARRIEASKKAQAIAEDENRTYKDRIAALNRAIALERTIAATREQFAAKSLDLARKQFDLSTKTREDREALNEAEIAFINTQSEGEQTRIELLARRSALEKERFEFFKKTVEFAQGVLDRVESKTPVDPVRLDLAKVNKDFDDLAKAAQEGIDRIKSIEKERGLTPEELALQNELSDSFVKIEEARLNALVDVLTEAAAKQLEVEEAQRRAQEALAKKDFERAKQAIEDVRDLSAQEIAVQEQQFANFITLLESQGIEKRVIEDRQFAFDNLIKEKTLKNEIAYQEALLKIIGAGDESQRKAIENQIALLKTQLEGLNIPAPSAPKEKPGQVSNIWQLFGVDDKEKQQAFSEAANQIASALGQITQARIAEAQAAVQASDTIIAEKRRQLEAEQKLAEEGKANNVDLIKSQIAEQEKIRADALKKEEQARKAAILLDTASQVSGLITSSVNIYKALSPLGPFGIAGAIATIALMFGSFAKAKADALKAVSVPKLRKGAKIQGATHEQGGVIVEVEDGEQVVGNKEARGNDTFFDRLRKGRYAGIDLAEAAEQARRRRVHSPQDGAADRIADIRSQQESVGNSTQTEAAIRLAADRIVDSINARPMYAPWKQGYKKIVKQGNTVTISNIQPQD
jgi:hypothetical protein